MNDTQKSKIQLIKELNELRNRVSELEQSEAISLDTIEEHSQVGEVRQLERNFMMNILDIIPDAIYIVNQQHEIEYINTVTKREFGPVKGRKCFEYLHDRTEICPWCKNDEVFAGKTVTREWYSSKNKRHYELVDMPFKNADGSISKFEIFHDVTARKQVEDLLQHRYEQIISATNEHMSFLDKDYIYKSVNTAYLKAHKKTVQEIIGHSVADLLGLDLFELFLKEKLDRCLDGEEIHYHKWFDFPGRGKRYMDVSYFPYIEKDGTVSGVVVSSHDITEHKQTEIALKESEEKFKTVADYTRDWEYWIGPDLSFNYVSPSVERITGYSPQEFYDDKEMLKKIIHPDDLSLVIGHPHRNIDGETAPINFRIVTKKGEIRWIGHVCREVINEEGKLLGRRGNNRDITDRVLAEQEKVALRERLIQTRKMESIGQLAGGIAHGFNNALTVVLGNIELLNIHMPNDETVQKFISPVKESAARMSRLTSQLLAYARGGKYQPEIILFNKFVEEAISQIKYSINPAIKIALDVDGKSYIKADSTQLQMVLSAVITNSAEAFEADGVIQVSTCQSKPNEKFIKTHPGAEAGSYICLCVEDNGCGMDKEALERIFEPFFTTKFQGRGLGMASVYGIVKNHNGYITVDSEPGRGTRVQIFFPLTAGISEEKPMPVSVPINGRGTILLIEDEKMVRKVGLNVLEHLGCRVLSAKNGVEAQHIVKTFDGTIDLVILDMGLPDIPGEILYFRLKEFRPDLKVIVCSGYAVDGPAQKLLDAGALDFIQKPYSISSISQALSKYLNNE